MNHSARLPTLNYRGNEQKKMTLHLLLQIMGKIRLKSTPRINHWLYVTQYVYTKGITTGPIPYNEGMDKFDITINVPQHQLEVNTSKQASAYAMGKSLITLRDSDLRGDLKKITVPTAILHRKLDKICSYDLAEQMHALIPNSILIPFDKSGHALFVEETAKFNSELVKFAQKQI
jgi:pimeloyl-ACP methyl ester carboxylesterase